MYGPDDTWPAHPTSDEWDVTLLEARELGWYLEVMSGHTWAHLKCSDDGLRPPDVCDYPVFKSAKGTDSKAKIYRKKVARCPHKERAPGPHEANRIADSVSNVLDAVDQMVNGLEDLAHVDVELTLAQGLIDEAEAALEAAIALETSGKDQLQDGAAMALQEGVSAGDPPSPQPLLDWSDSQLDDAADLVHGRSGGGVKAVRERIEKLRARHAELSAKVAALSSR